MPLNNEESVEGGLLHHRIAIAFYCGIDTKYGYMSNILYCSVGHLAQAGRRLPRFLSTKSAAGPRSALMRWVESQIGIKSLNDWYHVELDHIESKCGTQRCQFVSIQA
jgi:hypothetical protein